MIVLRQLMVNNQFLLHLSARHKIAFISEILI